MAVNGDALAAKLAELVAHVNRDARAEFYPEEASWILRALLAWVAEQGAAGADDGGLRWTRVEKVPNGVFAEYDPASPMPATDGNRPVNARTGAAPATEPSEGAESVNRARRRDDDPVPGCPCAGCENRRHSAPAPDAALRAGVEQALLVLDRACTEVALIAIEGPPKYRERRALKCQRELRAGMRAARAALSPDATGGDK